LALAAWDWALVLLLERSFLFDRSFLLSSSALLVLRLVTSFLLRLVFSRSFLLNAFDPLYAREWASALEAAMSLLRSVVKTLVSVSEPLCWAAARPGATISPTATRTGTA